MGGTSLADPSSALAKRYSAHMLLYLSGWLHIWGCVQVLMAFAICLTDHNCSEEAIIVTYGYLNLSTY